LILERGRRDRANGADFLHDDAGSAQRGRAIGAAAAAGALRAAAAVPPPPLNGGGCSTGCQSFLSGVITPARMFLSDQVSPEPSFFALPFSMPILAMKVTPSNCLRLTVRALRASGLVSSGLRPSALSRMAFSVP